MFREKPVVRPLVLAVIFALGASGCAALDEDLAEGDGVDEADIDSGDDAGDDEDAELCIVQNSWRYLGVAYGFGGWFPTWSYQDCRGTAYQKFCSSTHRWYKRSARVVWDLGGYWVATWVGGWYYIGQCPS